jgi:hypothetical protein
MYHAVKNRTKSKFMHFYLEHRDDYILSIKTVTKGNPEWLRKSVIYHIDLLSAMHPQEYVKTMMINYDGKGFLIKMLLDFIGF